MTHGEEAILDYADLAYVLGATSSREEDLNEKLNEYLDFDKNIKLECCVQLDYYGYEESREIVLQGYIGEMVTDEMHIQFPFLVAEFWTIVGEVEATLEELIHEEVEEGYDTLAISVYDNGGKTADRYTVLFIYGGSNISYWEVRTASEQPNLPNEVWMSLNSGIGDVPVEYTTMGRKLAWNSLSKPLRKVISDYIAFG